jgi:Lecithin:cholesterol acyltransferase
MMDIPVVTPPRIIASWIFMNTYLRSMGYRSGLTMQMIPYDFRYPLQHNDASFTLVRSLRLLNALTGKKAVIAGHSLGVEMTVYFMSQMSQADKDLLVSSGIGIGGPFDGAGEATLNLFGGSLLDMSIWGIKLGMTFNDTMRFISTVNTAFQMFPGDGYNR